MFVDIAAAWPAPSTAWRSLRGTALHQRAKGWAASHARPSVGPRHLGHHGYYFFSVAAVKLLQISWLEHHTFIISPCWRSEVLKSRCQQSCVSSGSSRGEAVSTRFPASRSVRIPHLWPLPHLQSPQQWTSSRATISGSLSCLPLPPLRTHVMTLGHLDSPASSLHAKVSWSATSHAPATLSPLGHVTSHIHSFSGLER